MSAMQSQHPGLMLKQLFITELENSDATWAFNVKMKPDAGETYSAAPSDLIYKLAVVSQDLK